MEQRALRLGDLVDDYCPRERRLTNHAVVAIVDESIRQTRCTTCDTEHPYKDGKTPRRRKKDEQGGLYDQVLSGVTGQLVVRTAAAPAPADADVADVVRMADEPDVPAAPKAAGMVAVAAVAVSMPPESAPSNRMPAPPDETAEPSSSREADELWAAHRPLIRAQLPRVEGQQPAQPQRPIHEFTMRQQNGRGHQSFRGAGGAGGNGGRPDRNGNGADNQRGGFRHGRFNGGGGRPGPGGGRPNRPGGGRGKPSR